MNTTRKLGAVVLVLLLGTTVYGLFRTAKPAESPATSRNGKHAATARGPLVDQSPLKTAQQLAQLAVTPEERLLAEEALRLGDHEVDLAFAAALRDATENPPTLSPEAKEIQARLESAQKRLNTDQALVDQLTQAEAKATGDKKEVLGDQLDLAKAELELDKDEVDDAKQDLIRAGGDPGDRIQEMVQEHDAAAHGTASAIPSAPPPPEERGLIRRFQQWSALHEKQMQIWRAKQEADTAASVLTAQHNALEARIEAAKQEIPELAHRSKKATATGPSPSAAALPRASDESAALVLITKQIASDQKALSVFDKRIDTEKQLSDNYGKWIDVVAAQQRAVINHILRGVLVILVIGLIGIYFSTVMDKVVSRLRLDRRQIQTLHNVSRVAVQVVAVLFILLVIFGRPGQLGTFLGLAGAGLTVALKDFIVGFIGWFVLMGKNGIRLGDWVEIKGVSGEVVELGMFHTVLLETGNWTDSGHPTGRRVTFTNSFAIEGHYFNFSTSGQWLWDELQVVLPTGQDPYPIIDAIQRKVVEATSESVKQAEQEWKSAARSRDMSALTAAPAINVRPVVGGVEIAVRYVTRANERYQLRARLYQAAVELLGGRGLASVQAPDPK
jgi:small-conductance mechanosensitive channel